MKRRLDQHLVAIGIAATRARARDAIQRGCVIVNGVQAVKAGQMVSETCEIAVSPNALAYVSRGALKLAAALDHFGYEVENTVALDIGSSTGGFTQVLLERNARRVYAVDVGHGQIDPSVCADERVVSMEGTDVRLLSPAHIAEPVDALVSDVSFISLKLALPPALALAAERAWLIALIKPQFEVGRTSIGKGGIVKDEAARQKAVLDLELFMSQQAGWQVDDIIPSPITGSGGNIEYLLGARRGW